MLATRKSGTFPGPWRFIRLAGVLVCAAICPISALADASGTIFFTQRFDGPMTIVNEVDWTYVRSTPSLVFSNQRVVWTGAGAQVGAGPPPEGCPAGRLAGSDGIFFTPNRELVVGNWEPGRCALSGQFWKFDPDQTDVVLEGPSSGPFAFHMLLHPNLEDFLATPALGGFACTDGGGNPRGCFGAYDHTPVTTSLLCLAPLDSADNDPMQPVTFIADGDNNMFALFTEEMSVQLGGAGFASFDIGSTTSASCGGDMAMRELIPVGIESAHSISWDPFLSGTTVRGVTPHSDFIVFANSTLAQIRVENPGTPGATASIVSMIDMASELVCESLLPPAMEHEFDQGAVTGDGIALVGDEHSGFLALIDYSQNTNGLILDGSNTVCMTRFLHEHLDDIAPLTGLGADPLLFETFFDSGFEEGETPPD